MKGRILVVDDEHEIRVLLSRHFRYAGYEVKTASDGLDALEKLEAGRVDVMVSDIGMPRMDGINLLERVRRDHPMLRTVMITGHVAQDAIVACMHAGAEACVFKPLEDLSELDQAVEAVLGTMRRWWRILADLGAGARSGMGGE